jgi:peptidoglycan hydrolase-like protein with peptidoglycan-binding domain
MSERIKSSVGSGGVNELMDVSVVQYLLNRASARVGTPLELIEVDGIMGPETLAAIREFQQRYFPKRVDGRLDPSGETLSLLRVTANSAFLNDGQSYLTPSSGPLKLA